MNWRQVINNVYPEKLSCPSSLIRWSEIQNSELGDPARVIELLRRTLGTVSASRRIWSGLKFLMHKVWADASAPKGPCRNDFSRYGNKANRIYQ
jgi:hypothetical protein